MEAVYNPCDVNANVNYRKSNSDGSIKKQGRVNVIEDECFDYDSPGLNKNQIKTKLFVNSEINESHSVKKLNWFSQKFSIDWKKLILNDETLYEKLSNFISDKIKVYIRDKYLKYLRLTQEERDFSKTGYTYAYSWSYDVNNQTWDWEVPNMSRMSVDGYRKKQGGSTTINQTSNQGFVIEDDQQSTGSSTCAISEFAVPSTPVQSFNKTVNSGRASPFTRSHCRGGRLCEANCDVHKTTRNRQRHKSKIEEGTRIAHSGIGLEPSDNFINEEREREASFSFREYFKDNLDTNDFDLFEHHKKVYTHRNTSEYYDQATNVDGPMILKSSNRKYFEIAKKAFLSLFKWRTWHLLFLVIALCLCSWRSGFITSDHISSITSIIASHSTFSASESSSQSYPPNLDAKSVKQLQELQQTMESVKDQLSHLTVELEKVKQDGFVSRENYSSLRVSLEDLNKKFNNCCRNETELVSFINENLVSILRKAQSEEGNAFVTLLRSVIVIEMQKLQVPQREIDDKINQKVDFVMQRLENMKTEMQQTVNDISLNLQTPKTDAPNFKAELTADDVKQLIREALFVYDADKTGVPDYALESSGGTVIDIRCSETFDPYGIQYKIFGIPVWSTSNSPRAVIQPTITPGDCWAFKGPQGHLVIRLSKKIVPTSFTYEHIAKQISRDGNIKSAPREFQVRGLKDENDSQGELLGSYYYEDNGMPLQNFAVTHPNPKPYNLIELVITSNHGHDEYTCLYRFRVHGKPIDY